MTLLNPQQLFSSAESLDSSEVTPTALFRDSSFDKTSEQAEESNSNGMADHHATITRTRSTHAAAGACTTTTSNHTIPAVTCSSTKATSTTSSSSLPCSKVPLPPQPRLPLSSLHNTSVKSQVKHQLQQHSQQQQLEQQQRNQSPLSNCSAVEAANVLFPPPTPNNHNSSSSSSSSKAMNTHYQQYHHHHHDRHNQEEQPAPPSSSSPPFKENCLNISLNNDNDTVVTEFMATDEDSFDISPVPSSPSSKRIVPSSNSRKRTSSDRKKSKQGKLLLQQHQMQHQQQQQSHHLNTSIPSSPLAFLNTRGGGEGENGIMGRNLPPSLPYRAMFSPSAKAYSHHPQQQHKKFHNLSFRSSIESSHSFDSHDSNTSTNDLLHIDSNNAIHYNHNYNSSSSNNSHNDIHGSSSISTVPTVCNSTGSGAGAAANTMTQHLRHPQSIHQLKSSSSLFTSAFFFSGSPIEEEENEDSSSPFYGNGKKAKIDCNANVTTNKQNSANMMMTNNSATTKNSGEDEQFSSKIRKLNLDCEMSENGEHRSTSTATICSINNSTTGGRNNCYDSLAIETNNEINSIYHHPMSPSSGGRKGLDHSSSSSSTGGGMVKCDSFRLHVNTHFNDDDDEGNDDISPTDVTEFMYPSSSSKNTPFKSTINNNHHHHHHETDSISCMSIDDKKNQNGKNNDMRSKRAIHNLDFEEAPLPSSFSSPPPIFKKGLSGPPSPYRTGRVGTMLLPPTTPMIPQKAMRRMRGHGGSCTPRSRDDSIIDCPSANIGETSRFDTDFEIMGTLGKGSFGTVYKCQSRLDSRLYAVKVAKRRAKGRADLDRMLKEVYALAKLSDVADATAFHIVRYHQAWMEEDKLHIVTELCTSTLQSEMESGILHGNTKRLYKLLREMLLALQLIHRHGMVHLDIKPENIFVREDIFKLGDFGLVSKVSVQDDVEEGDSRYMCMDLLSGNHKDLTKVSTEYDTSMNCSIFFVIIAKID